MLRASLAALLVTAAACGPNAVPHHEVVERTHLGVSCTGDVPHHTLNGGVLIDEYFAEQCDRVGLAVWLTKPAASMGASLAGEPITLRAAPPNSPELDPSFRGPSTFFVGFRQPAGFNNGAMHIGRKAILRLAVTRTNGKGVITFLTIDCCGGWG